MSKPEMSWERTEQLLDMWGPFERLPLGTTVIEPRNIVGLNRTTPERLLQDARLARLLRDVRETGWNDPFPDDLHLYLLPDGRYSVGSKGNVRSFAARVSGIPWIFARVDVVLPHRLLTQSILELLSSSSSEEFRQGLLLGQLARLALTSGFARYPK